MNKTLTVNIGGIVFNIEDLAYENLKRYLEAIKSHFSTSDGRDEIMQDIEARIAEMLQEYLTKSKMVIVLDDINGVINAMGKPEQFADSDEKASSQNSTLEQEQPQRNYKRIYRDTDDKIISGVCAGLSHRIGIDPLWLRLIWVFVTIVTWSGAFWLYIILAIVLPKAETPAQKLEMRGENVTISNLRKASEEPTPTQGKTKGAVSGFFETLGEIIVTIFKGFVYFIGVILAICGIGIFVGLFMVLLAVLGVGAVAPVGMFDMFVTSSQQLWISISLLLVVGIPIFMLIYVLAKAIFKIKASHPWLRISALVLWIAGLAIGITTVGRVARDFAYEGKKRNNITLVQPASDTLYVDVIKDPDFDRHSNRHFDLFGKRFNSNSGKMEYLMPDNIDFTIEKSENNQYELTQVLTAHGNSDEDAYNNAANINYSVQQKDSSLLLGEYYPIKKGDHFRNQHVRLILKVPVGKSVYLSNSTKHIIYDIDNVSNTWDNDMVGHTWTMTEKGLKCIGCNLDSNNNDSSDWDSESSANQNATVNIDENGISIQTDSDTLKAKDVDIKVNKNGVHIETKGTTKKSK